MSLTVPAGPLEQARAGVVDDEEFLAFQNCHRVAVFAPSAPEDAWPEFVSPRAQILNQSPELINC